MRAGTKRELSDSLIAVILFDSFVDQGKNPHLYTKDFIERVAGENMYTNGILSAVTVSFRVPCSRGALLEIRTVRLQRS